MPRKQNDINQAGLSPRVAMLNDMVSKGVKPTKIVRETSLVVIDLARDVAQVKRAINGSGSDKGLKDRIIVLETLVNQIHKAVVIEANDENQKDDSFMRFWFWIRDKALPPVASAIIVFILANSF